MTVYVCVCVRMRACVHASESCTCITLLGFWAVPLVLFFQKQYRVDLLLLPCKWLVAEVLLPWGPTDLRSYWLEVLLTWGRTDLRSHRGVVGAYLLTLPSNDRSRSVSKAARWVRQWLDCLLVAVNMPWSMPGSPQHDLAALCPFQKHLFCR